MSPQSSSESEVGCLWDLCTWRVRGVEPRGPGLLVLLPLGFWAGFLQPCCFVFQKPLVKIERFEFYERAKKAFAVVATG